MGIQSCFAEYGAILKNVNWSVSSFNDKGELVVSLWNQFFKKTAPRKLTYIDRTSRWSGNGNTEFIKNLDKGFSENVIVRVVIARTDDEDAVRDGKDASKLKNKFHTRSDWKGKITVWDGDNFEIEFEPE